MAVVVVLREEQHQVRPEQAGEAPVQCLYVTCVCRGVMLCVNMGVYVLVGYMGSSSSTT